MSNLSVPILSCSLTVPKVSNRSLYFSKKGQCKLNILLMIKKVKSLSAKTIKIKTLLTLITPRRLSEPSATESIEKHVIKTKSMCSNLKETITVQIQETKLIKVYKKKTNKSLQKNKFPVWFLSCVS